MKTPQQWQEELRGETSLESIREIQNDSLRRAAALCSEQLEDGNPESGHANRGIFACIDAIEIQIRANS